MPTYRAFQVTGQRQFELVERDIVDPEPGHVRVRVLACGVCHSDFLGVEGVRPDPSQPVVPGHEIVGVVDAVGPGVTAWQRRRPGGPWLPRRPLRRVRTVPAGRFRQLSQPASARNHRRRRLRGDGVRPRHRLGQSSGVDEPDRRSATAVRRNHHVQRAAPRRRSPWRRGRYPGHRRPRPYRPAAGKTTRLPNRCDRPRHGQGRAGDIAGRRRLHRQRGDRPRRGAAGIGRCGPDRGDRGQRSLDVATGGRPGAARASSWWSARRRIRLQSTPPT